MIPSCVKQSCVCLTAEVAFVNHFSHTEWKVIAHVISKIFFALHGYCIASHRVAVLSICGCLNWSIGK